MENQYFCFDRETSNRKRYGWWEQGKWAPLKRNPKYMNYHQPSLPQKQSKKSQDHEMTKELLSSILAKDEEDEVDMLMGSIAKWIKKNLPDDEAEECMQELTDVINRYIRVAKWRRNPTATPAAPPAPEQSPGPSPGPAGPSRANFLPPMPPLMQMNLHMDNVATDPNTSHKYYY